MAGLAARRLEVGSVVAAGAEVAGGMATTAIMVTMGIKTGMVPNWGSVSECTRMNMVASVEGVEEGGAVDADGVDAMMIGDLTMVAGMKTVGLMVGGTMVGGTMAVGTKAGDLREGSDWTVVMPRLLVTRMTPLGHQIRSLIVLVMIMMIVIVESGGIAVGHGRRSVATIGMAAMKGIATTPGVIIGLIGVTGMQR